jgi:hypothetical protein
MDEMQVEFSTFFNFLRNMPQSIRKERENAGRLFYAAQSRMYADSVYLLCGSVKQILPIFSL